MTGRLLRFILCLLVVCACDLHAPVQAKVLAQWVQLDANGAASVRAITDGACPGIIIDGTSHVMTIRSQPQMPFANVKPATLNVIACQAAVPEGAIAANIDGKPLALPRSDPQRIVVFGDTGCRLSNGDAVQACNDPKAWPFPAIARAAAATHPDLVIHVGDYLYRENPCPAAETGCAGSPYGYGWDSWAADFFDPASPLLDAAPWVFARGNHEDCSRAAEGWFRFLDHAPLESACRDLSGAFVARMGDFGVVVVDGAKAADPKTGGAEMTDVLRRQFASIAPQIPGEAWLVTHRPLDAMRPGNNGGANVVENSIQDLALSSLVPRGVRMFVSGHIHFFQAVDFGGAAPPQLVVGTGGDNLEPIPPMSLAGSRINGKVVRASSAYSGFAYMIWDRKGAAWNGTLFDATGKPLDRCLLNGRSLRCGL